MTSDEPPLFDIKVAICVGVAIKQRAPAVECLCYSRLSRNEIRASRGTRRTRAEIHEIEIAKEIIKFIVASGDRLSALRDMN